MDRPWTTSAYIMPPGRCFLSPSWYFPLMGHSNDFDGNAPLGLEDDSNFKYGKITFWDDSYKKSLSDFDVAKSELGGKETKLFSWYCGWHDELEPFFTELVPPEENPKVLIPGIGNDACIRDMFDYGYHRLTAFDYAPEGVECASRMFGPERLQKMDDLRVADARSLPYGNGSFDSVLEKGTLDSIYLSGEKDKQLARENLGMAVAELARVVRRDGIIFSVTAACAEAVQKAFDDHNKAFKSFEQLRDGSFYTTEDGYTSNNVDATMLVWRRI
mmetsp:Transcript_7276/g.15646  ORF Transcript_7276/g.15646 Transcript_7276/m.15646 type:complete len:273 (+) Transcript_7276:83-901(+)